MSVAAGAFSGGLALGFVVFLIIIIVGWRRRRKEPSDDGQSDLQVARGLGGTRSERLRNATYVSAAFFGGAIVVLAVFYAWFGGIFGFEGQIAEMKQVSSRRSVEYYLVVDGKEHKTSEDLYERARRGDHVKKSFAMPYTFLNGERIDDAFTSFAVGLYLGLCGCGALYGSLRFYRMALTEVPPPRLDEVT